MPLLFDCSAEHQLAEDLGQDFQIEQLTHRLQQVELLAEKLQAAVDHRDSVISQLAMSRKLVFEECHRACANNQTELRQMQEALHKVTRQLQQERREHAARVRELNKQTAYRRTAVKRPALDCLPEVDGKFIPGTPERDASSAAKIVARR